MHHSSIQLQSHEAPPEPLVNFLDGRPPASTRTSDTDQEPPKKRPRLTRVDASNVALPPRSSDGYLTLARVDLSIAFAQSPGESYPSPSSDKTQPKQPHEKTEQFSVLLEAFTRTGDGEYQCRIATVTGEILMDNLVHSNISPQTLEVLQKAIEHSIIRTRQDVLKSTFVLSPSFGFVHDGATLGFGHDPHTRTMDLCARICVPNARDMNSSIGISRKDVLDVCTPDLISISDVADAWSPRDFYDCVHVPENDGFDPEIEGLDAVYCKLYPFQKRALQWLLWREGAEKAYKAPVSQAELPPGFVKTTDGDGIPCFVSCFLGIFTTDKEVLSNIGFELRGGILAEEMGLGKTVEIMALMSLHRLDTSKKLTRSSDRLPQSSATLIVTPPPILLQWKTELDTLAPSLSVFIYDGFRLAAGKQECEESLSQCMQHDVVLTTYNVLAKEIHYAETVDRSLRHEKRYEKRLSPLTRVVWWRVVLDEAQMVESGVSNAAKVAKLIPREIAWCVSGTPVKKDARDLFGLLDFLQYKPYCNLPGQACDRLVRYHKNEFKQIFGTLALRHTKDQIKGDLQLPTQKRIVITVPFTLIEEQHYSAMFKQMSEDCGLNLDGSPATDDWDPDSHVSIEKMRSWLTRLRQTCLHPEVGARNRRALGNGKGPLRTVGEVLDAIIEQNDTATRTEERSLLLSQIRRGQILEHAGKSEVALQIWLQTLEEAKSIVQECRDHLQAEIGRLCLTEDLMAIGDGAGETESATANRSGPHRQRLRAAIEIEHMCTFFVANAYFQIKSDIDLTKPESNEFDELEEKEKSAYEQAKLLRRELLREAYSKAKVLMARINDKVIQKSFVEIPKISPFKERGGIESWSYYERLDRLVEVMQEQATQLEEWRNKTTELLLLPLMDEDQDVNQDEDYENSTKIQAEVYVYVDALRALIADRHDIVTGQHNELVKYEMSVALKQAKEGQGHSPHLLVELLSIRHKLKPPKDLGSVRGITTELRELKNALRSSAERGNSRAAAESIIVNSALLKLHQIQTAQTKALTGLDRQIELFKDTMNLRLEYYRQLQAISDTVAPYEEEMTEEARKATLLEKTATEHNIKTRIATLKSKGRYLIHLRDEATNVEAQRLCIICQQTFEVGILTACGHSYCVDCLRMWWLNHRNCPTCKKHLSRNDFHQITYKPQELTMEEEAPPKEKDLSVAKDTEDSAIYSGIRLTYLNQIKNIDLDGSFGTKIDTLARHILWIREHDPGAKSIIFSQYRDFLDVLARAFSQFKIGYASFDKKGGILKFKSDPSKECFFLHARAHSSGLNLVNATHVFLCEPLINTAIELQAIARVHRIGQHQETTVWMYLVEDTVEKSIYDISVTRRLAHMGQVGAKATCSEDASLQSKIEAANTLELEQASLDNLLAKGSTGGEMVGKEDLWNCLFRQRPGQTGRVSEGAERVVARHLGVEAAEARLGQGEDAEMIDAM